MQEAFYNCCITGSVRAARLLLKFSTIRNNINAYCDPTGSLTPLIGAIIYGHYNIVHLLIGAGADANISDYVHETTPLVIAFDYRKHDICKLLLESCPNINVDNVGMRVTIHYPPLLYAILHNQNELIKLIIDRGADINLVWGGSTFIQWATKQSYSVSYDTLRILIEAGCHIDDDSRKSNIIIDYVVYDIGLTKTKNECIQIVNNLLLEINDLKSKEDHYHDIDNDIIDITEYINISNTDRHQLIFGIYELDKIINKLTNKRDIMKNHILYKPNGLGYIEAKLEFDKMALN